MTLPDPAQLARLVNMKMPFGKYAGRALMDLPEEYLLWFSQTGFPKGELGELMALVLLVKSEGLQDLLKPLQGKY